MAILFTKRGIIKHAPLSSHTPGDIIIWDRKEWLVCHYDSSKNQVYLIAKDIITNSLFGSNNKYAGSALAQTAMVYQTTQMSVSALEQCVDVTVNGVTAKVFVPSYAQFNGGFSWFDSDDHRKATSDTSWYAYYWTSSAYGSSEVYAVKVAGGFSKYSSPDSSYGFRPCVCVQL